MRHIDCIRTFHLQSCASTSFIFSSMSTVFGCKVDEIFQCQDSTQAACSSGNSVVKESSSGYFLVKNLQTFVKSPHNSSDKKKRRMWKNHEELKEKLHKVMTNNLHLHNIFHQCSSLPYTGKENWLHFITKNNREYYFKPLLHSWSCYSFCKEYVKKRQYSCTERIRWSSFSNSNCTTITYLLKVEVYSNCIHFLWFKQWLNDICNMKLFPRSPDIQINLSVLHYCWIRNTIASLNMIHPPQAINRYSNYGHFTTEQ